MHLRSLNRIGNVCVRACVRDACVRPTASRRRQTGRRQNLDGIAVGGGAGVGDPSAPYVFNHLEIALARATNRHPVFVLLRDGVPCPGPAHHPNGRRGRPNARSDTSPPTRSPGRLLGRCDGSLVAQQEPVQAPVTELPYKRAGPGQDRTPSRHNDVAPSDRIATAPIPLASFLRACEGGRGEMDGQPVSARATAGQGEGVVQFMLPTPNLALA
jgi:hypothetical protein